MTWLAFISSLIASLAWPTAVTMLAFKFRPQLASILNRLTKAKGFGGEVEFAQQLDKAEILSPPVLEVPGAVVVSPERNLGGMPQIVPDTPLGESGKNHARHRISTEADIPPAYRVIIAWKLLSSELARAVSNKGLKVPSFWGPREIRDIGPALGLRASDIEQIGQLRNLRNRAAHEDDEFITVTDGLRYEDLVSDILLRIEAGSTN